MLTAFFYIRLKQLLRGLRELGLFRLLFVFGMFVFGLAVVFKLASDSDSAMLLSGGVVILLFVLQLHRNDKRFLKTHFKNHKSIVFAEYFLLAVPISICLLFFVQWQAFLVLLAGLFLVIHPGVKPKGITLNTPFQEWIPGDCIEWKAGLRRWLIVIIPLWCIGLVSSFTIGGVPLVIFLMGIILISFYEKSEPYQMIIALELSPSAFLVHKIKRHLLLYAFISLPLILAYVIFNLEYWYVPIAEYLIFCLLHTYVIIVKYAFYEPNVKSSAAQTFAGIGLLGCILPILLPLVIVLIIWFSIKSTNNLKFYLHDFN